MLKVNNIREITEKAGKLRNFRESVAAANMSQSLFQQPENLTKDRLKVELKKHGVPFDLNENKDYYVRLYRSKVVRSAGRRQRGELSSDEELVRRSPRFGTKKQPVSDSTYGTTQHMYQQRGVVC